MDFQKLRQTKGYRNAGYAAYVGLGLCFFDYASCAGTSNALLGMFLLFPLFIFTAIVPLIFLAKGCREVNTSQNTDTYGLAETNIIHDIGLFVWMAVIILVGVLFILDGIIGITGN